MVDKGIQWFLTGIACLLVGLFAYILILLVAAYITLLVV